MVRIVALFGNRQILTENALHSLWPYQFASLTRRFANLCENKGLVNLKCCKIHTMSLQICLYSLVRGIFPSKYDIQSSRAPTDHWDKMTWPVIWIFCSQSGCKWSLQQCLEAFARVLDTQNPYYRPSHFSPKIMDFPRSPTRLITCTIHLSFLSEIKF